MTRRNKRGEQSGIIVVFLSVLIIAFIIFVALVVDIGRILASQRQLLNAADTASLTAVNLFRINGDVLTPSSAKINAWKAVKKAVLASLQSSQIFGCDGTCLSLLSTQAAQFTSGTATICDDASFSHDTQDIGNLNVVVQRGVFCREASGFRHFFSLEGSAGQLRGVQYCYANAVRVSLKLSNVSSTFAKFIGVTSLHTSAMSESYVTPDTRSCTDDSCSSFGTLIGSGATATFVPFTCNTTHGLVGGSGGSRSEQCQCPAPLPGAAENALLPSPCADPCGTSCCGRPGAAVCLSGCAEQSCGPACGC